MIWHCVAHITQITSLIIFQGHDRAWQWWPLAPSHNPEHTSWNNTYLVTILHYMTSLCWSWHKSQQNQDSLYSFFSCRNCKLLVIKYLGTIWLYDLFVLKWRKTGKNLIILTIVYLSFSVWDMDDWGPKLAYIPQPASQSSQNTWRG